MDDLFAQMKGGMLPALGNPELAWARQYELGLIPKGSRFPRKGDLYESKQDQTAHYLTTWAAPFSGGGGGAVVPGGTRLGARRPRGRNPTALERRMVPEAERNSPQYTGFYFYFKTVKLNDNFTLVRTGFDGTDRLPAPKRGYKR